MHITQHRPPLRMARRFALSMAIHVLRSLRVTSPPLSFQLAPHIQTTQVDLLPLMSHQLKPYHLGGRKSTPQLCRCRLGRQHQRPGLCMGPHHNNRLIYNLTNFLRRRNTRRMRATPSSTTRGILVETPLVMQFKAPLLIYQRENAPTRLLFNGYKTPTSFRSIFFNVQFM